MTTPYRENANPKTKFIIKDIDQWRNPHILAEKSQKLKNILCEYAATNLDIYPLLPIIIRGRELYLKKILS